MKEHAKSIWQAALDGKTVQYLVGGFDHEWVDMDPFECNYFSQPQQVPDRWRIKPNTEIRFYRIYFSTSFRRPRIFIQEDYNNISPERFEKVSYFGGWLTDWIPYEVKV